jgi:hypothetical protein
MTKIPSTKSEINSKAISSKLLKILVSNLFVI